MEKFIVFEGISGSGKSTLIQQIGMKIPNYEEIKWFDNELVGKALFNIENMISVSRDLFSLGYALDFYGKYKYCIEPLIGKKTLLLHRYIYTPLTHDFVRGTKKELLLSWYKKPEIKKPDVIIFLDVPPQVALDRILSYRKPSFYECGLDIFFWDELRLGKIKYKNNEFEIEELCKFFLKYQTEIYHQYVELFTNMKQVLWVKAGDDCTNIMGKIEEMLIEMEGNYDV